MVSTTTQLPDRERVIGLLLGFLASPGTTTGVVDGRRGRPRTPIEPVPVSLLARRERVLAALRALEPRERLVLFRWFIEDRPPSEIARELGVSRTHCYRIRDRALAHLVETTLTRRSA